MHPAVALLTILFAWSALASSAEPKDLGRLTFITPKEGEAAALDDGYRRHLAWHAQAGDLWIWHGWTIISGDRIGTLVDATLDHAASDFDRPVDPAGDRADNEKNTVPHAAKFESFLIRRRDELGGGGAILDAPLLQVWDLRVRIDGIEDLERLLRASAAATRERKFTWFEIVSGGPLGRYLLVASASRPSALDTTTADPLPRSLYPDLPDDARRALARTVRSVRAELLRYRPDLSYAPE